METVGSSNFSKNDMEENALNRVVNLPVVMSTWNAMHNYYTSVKKNHPTVTPYLEAAEYLTTSAAIIAITKSKPIMDKFGPTVNFYANIGLDTLEDKVPIVTKQPEEIYASTRSKAANLLTNKVNGALDVAEKYVDYFLPSDDEFEMDNISVDDSDDEDDDDNNDISDTSLESDEIEDNLNPKERLQIISNKVRQRSYQKAQKKWSAVQMRSREAASKLHLTVDLIQYAQSAYDSSSNAVAAANETVRNRMSATCDELHHVADSVNHQVEERILKQARIFTHQLNVSCQAALKQIQTSPLLYPLLDQASKAKEATEDLYSAFAGKTSLSQLSNAFVELARPKILFVESTLLMIVDTLLEQPPISWMLSKRDIQGQSVSKDKTD